MVLKSSNYGCPLASHPPKANMKSNTQTACTGTESPAPQQSWPHLYSSPQEESAQAGQLPSLVFGRQAFLFGAALKPGFILGGFQLVAEMQRTASAVLWEARQVNLKRRVALRIMRRDSAQQSGGFEAFKKVARATAQLEHPNIAQVFAVGRQGRAAFLAREWVRGLRLDHLLDKLALSGERPLPISLPFFDSDSSWSEGIARLVVPLADALCLAHDAGIVHGAIWPGNLVVTPEGGAKWIDLANGSPLVVAAKKKMRPWLSPARMGSKRATPADDVYGLGALLYQSLVLENRMSLRRKTAILMRSSKSEIPIELRRIVLRALEEDPAVRYPTMHEFKSDLQTFLCTRAGRRNQCCAWIRTLWKRMVLRFQRRIARGAQAQMYVR